MRYRVKQLRAGKGLSQRQAAELVGVSLDMIKSIEIGRTNPSLQTALRMKKVFGCHCIDELIDDAG